jgi:hypothetical protein
VLIFVLRDHPVHVAAVQQRLRRPGGRVERLQDALAHVGHHGERLRVPGKGQLAAGGTGVLERVEHPRHLTETHGSLQVAEQPQLLEVGDVPQIPCDGAHQPVVLPEEPLLREGGDEQQRSLTRVREYGGDFAGFEAGVRRGERR